MGDTGDASVRDEINATVGRMAALAYGAERHAYALAPRPYSAQPPAQAIDGSSLDLLRFRDVRLAHGSTMFHLCFDGAKATLGPTPKSGSATLRKALFSMKLRELSRSIDVERVILVPVMALLLLCAVIALFSGGNHASSSVLVAALYVSYQVLMTVFYVMVVIFLLTRNPASARSRGIAPTVAAYVGTFLPFLFAFAGGSAVSEGFALFAVGLMTLGMSFTVYSLITLGKSFGVKPQVRTLVQHGPYRLIRNPLYVGEMVTLTGAVCFEPTLLKIVILFTLGVIQAYRAAQEEQLLEANLPQYAAYKLRTKRFVPGVF
jgi:protein-S-isoprenylcysteine O-methyltransferase Ste14